MKIKNIYEKLLKVRGILKEFSETMSKDFIGADVIYMILGWLLLAILVLVSFKLVGVMNPWPSLSIMTLIAVVGPIIYGGFSLIHFSILHGILSKRLHQLCEIAKSV